MAEHFIVKCPECGVVLAQCRCPDRNKTVRFQLCADCLKKDPKTLQGK